MKSFLAMLEPKIEISFIKWCAEKLMALSSWLKMVYDTKAKDSENSKFWNEREGGSGGAGWPEWMRDIRGYLSSGKLRKMIDGRFCMNQTLCSCSLCVWRLRFSQKIYLHRATTKALENAFIGFKVRSIQHGNYVHGRPFRYTFLDSNYRMDSIWHYTAI